MPHGFFPELPQWVDKRMLYILRYMYIFLLKQDTSGSTIPNILRVF